MSATLDALRLTMDYIINSRAVLENSGEDFLSRLAEWRVIDKGRSYFYQDARSLNIFDWVQQYRCIFSLSPQIARNVDLPNTPFSKQRWQELLDEAIALDMHVNGDYILDRIDTWLLEAYTLSGLCEVEAGDIVLDCGTFTGNTSLYFSQRAGSAGHVYGFEPEPSIYSSYMANMEPYHNVTPVQAAVSNSNEMLSFTENSFGSSLHTQGSIKVQAIRLDDFARQKKLKKVDFIKMDIEGAEADALYGAAAVIKRHQPKMALSAYHRTLDIVHLPEVIRSIEPGYNFVLRHFSNRECETVLYCIPPAKNEDYKKFCAKDPAPAPSEITEEAAHSVTRSILSSLSAALAAKINYESRMQKAFDSQLAGQTAQLAVQSAQLAEQSAQLTAQSAQLAEQTDYLIKFASDFTEANQNAQEVLDTMEKQMAVLERVQQENITLRLKNAKLLALLEAQATQLKM